MKIWTLTTDSDEVNTSVHTSEQDAYKVLRENYALELPEDTSELDLVEYLTEGEGRQGLAFWVDEHELPGVQVICTYDNSCKEAAIALWHSPFYNRDVVYGCTEHLDEMQAHHNVEATHLI